MTDQFLGLHPQSMLDSGVSSFNGSLLGTVLPALFHLVSDQGHGQESKLWVAVCFGSFVRQITFPNWSPIIKVEPDIIVSRLVQMIFFSVFISSALLNSLGKLNAPFMTLPFNFIALISFLNFQSSEFSPPAESDLPLNDR